MCVHSGHSRLGQSLARGSSGPPVPYLVVSGYCRQRHTHTSRVIVTIRGAWALAVVYRGFKSAARPWPRPRPAPSGGAPYTAVCMYNLQKKKVHRRAPLDLRPPVAGFTTYPRKVQTARFDFKESEWAPDGFSVSDSKVSAIGYIPFLIVQAWNIPAFVRPKAGGGRAAIGIQGDGEE